MTYIRTLIRKLVKYSLKDYCSELYKISGVTCCYGLFPDKRRQTYETFFSLIREEIIAHSGNLGALRFVILDFEIATHTAARTVFPEATTRGCLFHFGQCLIRNVQRLGMMRYYEDEESDFHKWIKLIKSMALIPA